MRRFNLLFPIIFIASETIIISAVSSFMHYLTFTSWNFYNTMIVLFWILTNIYTKSYNIGRGVSYVNTVRTALKSIFILFSVVSIVNLFVEPYASENFLFSIRRRNFFEPVTFVLSPTLTKFESSLIFRTSNPDKIIFFLVYDFSLIQQLLLYDQV